MSEYKQITAGTGSTQHNGAVYGGQTNHYTLVQRPGEDVREEAIVPLPSSVRSLDARFDGDERAIAIWLKRNNLHVLKVKHAKGMAPVSSVMIKLAKSL